MDKLYYEVDFCRCKTSTEKTMLRKLAKDGDCIEWYNDGKNIFFGDCACNEKAVIYAVVKATGAFNADYYEAGEIY